MTVVRAFLLCLPIAAAPVGFVSTALANPGGDGGIEVWVDGPDELQIGSDRTVPDVAVDPAGRTIYVWTAFDTGVRNDVYLRRFDASGNALSNPIQINTLTDDDQRSPRLAVSADGSFLVIWQSEEFDEEAGQNRRWVRSQAFDANAQPVGTEQLVSTESSAYGVDIHADVAALTGGGYVVVWARNNAAGDDTNRHIQARLIAANGVPGGGSFVANSTIGENEVDPAVTELDDGGFFIVWSGYEVWGRRFDASGSPQGDDVQLNTYETGAEANPDVVRGTDGRILLVWEDAEESGDDYEIRGRMFSPTLTPLGTDFRINTLSQDVQRPVRAGAYGKLGFLVAWESDVSAGDDNDPRSIQGRTVTGNNQFGGPQFQVNAFVTNGQTDPGVGGWGDSVAVVWRSLGIDEDPNDDVIIGESWSVCGIFCDSFE